MKTPTTRKMQAFILAVGIALAGPAVLAQSQQSNAPQAQAAAPAAQTSFCGNRPLCYESADFAATVSEFRTSTDAYGNKILDAILHFQNKTSQALSLGYVDGSGSALDDRGNRYGLNSGYGGVRGMGIISGNNMDPKFVLSPGGSGDARFELAWRPGANAIVGVNYEMELDIREMNRVEGNQWVLGGETLLHYQGLANGAGVALPSSVGSSFVPSQLPLSSSSTQPVCPPGTTAGTIAGAANSAGTQNANTQSTISNAESALSNLKSIFGGKKNTAPAATNTASAAPCVPTTTGTTNTGYTAPTAINTATPQAGSSAARTATTPTAASQAAGTQRTTVPAAKAVVTQRTPVTSTTQRAPAPATKAVAIKPVPAATPAKPSPSVPAAKKPATQPASQNGSPQ